jgi:molybdopterin synthase sulfur carrier subunit
MADILYFASLAETLGARSEKLPLPADCRSVTDLVALLRARGEPFDSTFGGQTRILVAINQEMSEPDAEISDSDEIAFFPPVTGG